MKRALFLALLMSISGTAIAECIWQESWMICPQPDEFKQGIRFTSTYKYSKKEPVQGKPLSFRHWIAGDFSSQGQYIGNQQYSWLRYYEIDCQNKTVTTLDDQYSGVWEQQNTELARNRNIGRVNYYPPGSFQELVCQQIVSDYNAYLEGQQAEQSRLAKEAEAVKQLENEKKPIIKTGTKKK